MLLGYIPDRAYYFTVFSTIDLGINVVSPINLCPPENKDLPCPVPAGAALPWEPSPPELGLPAPRTDGSAVQSGSNFLYVGGSDGTAAQRRRLRGADRSRSARSGPGARHRPCPSRARRRR